jgi:DNA-binding transcriptional LysR family regulator
VGTEMDMRRLSSFVAVAEYLNFGRAAERMSTVQSAISQQIKLLEEEVGVRLVDRSRHHVLWLVLPALLRAFRERYTSVELGLQQLDRMGQIKGLDNREIDLGIMPFPPPGSGLDSTVLLQAPLVAALPRGHRLTGRKRLALEELAEEPFVLFPPSKQTRLVEIILTSCASANFIPNVTQEAQQMQTLLALVSAGLGVTLVPQWVASANMNGIVYRKLSTPSQPYGLVLVWQAESSNNAIRSFINVAHEIIPTVALS